MAKISPMAAGSLWQSYHRLRRELEVQERALSGREPGAPARGQRGAKPPVQVALGDLARAGPLAPGIW